MTSSYSTWRGPARSLAVAVETAVGAATGADGAAFADALVDVRKLDREQLLVLLGTATQDLLERAAPDGLDAEEAERMLRGCLGAAAPWYDELDGSALLHAFTAGVGVGEPDEGDESVPRPSPDAVLAHGLLLVGYLIVTTAAPLPEVLEHALSELRRAQTVELP